MQIKIEIDVKPEELRRFLGLPDVAGLQEDVIHFLREKVAGASENFDPATFVRDYIENLRRSKTLHRLLYGTGENPQPSRPRKTRRPAAAETADPAEGKAEKGRVTRPRADRA